MENTEGKKDTCNGVVLLDDDLMLTDESDDEHVSLIFIASSRVQFRPRFCVIYAEYSILTQNEMIVGSY